MLLILSGGLVKRWASTIGSQINYVDSVDSLYTATTEAYIIIPALGSWMRNKREMDLVCNVL